jgi:hypothetical protein
MKPNLSFVGAVMLAFGLLTPLLQAGTPLICHPYQIGSAASLPGGDLKGVDPTYDRSRLTEDTLALLKAETPILVRMETLRRAAIYASGNLRAWNGARYTSDDRKCAAKLIDQLRERTQHTSDEHRALALFDLGFFAETVRQTQLDPALDGYALLEQVVELRPQDPDVQFALALAGSYPDRKPQHAAHLERARRAAKPGSLLAANLQSHFGHR